MKFISIIIVIFIICISPAAHAQSKAAYLEAGGAGLVETFNFDSRVKPKQGDGFGWRLGIGASPKYIQKPGTGKVSSISDAAGLFLVGVNTFFDPEYSHSTGHNIELGANVLFATKNSYAEKRGSYKGKSRVIPSLNIGYRLQRKDEKGFIWRLCYTPFFLDGKLRQWGGISAGYQF